jgi:hypothetical protein
LDNSDNIRPDWFEYWPIRKFLTGVELIEDQYYGFFSPRFQLKTGHDYHSLEKEITACSNDLDMLFICPQPEIGYVFKNIFYGFNAFDPGALETYQRVFDKIGENVDLKGLITDSRNTIYSNYIIAKPVFWRKWLAICEKIFNIAEGHTDDVELKNELNIITNHDSAQRKIFMIEGIATHMVKHYDLKIKSIELDNTKAWAGIFYPIKKDAIVCDALKIAYQATNLSVYMDSFHHISQVLIQRIVNILTKQPGNQSVNN